MVALGFLHLSGGPVALLQCVAWAGMLVSYSAEDGLVQGVTDTFSGERPCSLCERVREMERERPEPALPTGEEQRRITELLGQSMRLAPISEAPGSKAADLTDEEELAFDALRPEQRDERPASPPPRARA